MNVVLIGSGNVATVIGRLVTRNNHKVIQVVSRNIDHAKTLASELNAAFSDYNGQLDKSADIYIIAVSDMAIHECVQHFNIHDKIVVHTAGSVQKMYLKIQLTITGCCTRCRACAGKCRKFRTYFSS